MSQVAILLGWVCDIFCLIWIVVIILDMLFLWIFGKSTRGFIYDWIHGLAQLPVNFLRVTIPTVYRTMDFAPWLTLLVIVLLKTFVFRALVYWGMLHRLPGGSMG